MKVGSLVVCIKSSSYSSVHKQTFKGKIYTIRGIQYIKGIPGLGLIFEEIINDVNNDTGCEFDYCSSRFRELDTPTEINLENILELEIV